MYTNPSRFVSRFPKFSNVLLLSLHDIKNVADSTTLNKKALFIFIKILANILIP